MLYLNSQSESEFSCDSKNAESLHLCDNVQLALEVGLQRFFLQHQAPLYSTKQKPTFNRLFPDWFLKMHHRTYIGASFANVFLKKGT